ncbi:MAG: homocysteine S-methyltransferase family protein [Bacteroidetes bacterium]|nr:homocysteine S-methyltransferase family protein [Bacteroidota bacterium]
MDFESCFSQARYLLTEGALVERLKSEYNLTMDRYVNHAGLIYDSEHRLSDLYCEYIETARKYRLPILLMTPTRRVNFESHRQSAFRDKDLLSDSCTYLEQVRDRFPDYADKIFIGGLLGCKGDAYNAAEALDKETAFRFHSIQVRQFEQTNVDFLFAGIMPALSEALGMAQAMATAELPYIISFMVRKDGMLLDKTPIAEAIRIIDSQTHRQPLCYMANCIHPANLRLALETTPNAGSLHINRFCGIQANASPLSPEELNNCCKLHQSNFDEMVDNMEYLAQKHRLKILGGCCGTDNSFIEKLSERLISLEKIEKEIRSSIV